MELAPKPLDVLANGLTHRVLEWTTPAVSPATGATALLLHGFMDAAATWDRVAPILAREGFRVLAPDLRGYGDGARLPPGSYYYFPDYVLDVADLVEALVPPAGPLLVVGHSMGGTVATLYTGASPARVSRLVLVEGTGPVDGKHEHVPDRVSRWIDGVRSARERGVRTMASRDEALDRLAANHPRVDREILRTRLPALARELPDGRLSWKADPLHGTRSPVPFFAETYKAFARRVTCPVLFVSGGPLGWHPPDEQERVESFPHLSRVDIEDAGHMIHWTHPDVLSKAIVDFAGDLTGRAGHAGHEGQGH
jgi:pimeloyl-ACP methyl ester carboxylesterase